MRSKLLIDEKEWFENQLNQPHLLQNIYFIQKVILFFVGDGVETL